jgi:hypothetical protein
LINVNGDLLGATLGGDMLGARQRRPPTLAGKPDEILRYQRYRAPRAPLPRRVRRRIDDDLTHDSPTRMVRIATRNEEPGQRLGHPQSSGLGPVTVQVSQCGTHVPAALHCPGELPRSPPRLASFIIDPSTVLGRKAALMLHSDDQRQSPPRSATGSNRLRAPRQTRPLADGRTGMRAVAGRRQGRDDRISRKRSTDVPDPSDPSPLISSVQPTPVMTGKQKSAAPDPARVGTSASSPMHWRAPRTPKGRKRSPERCEVSARSESQ